MTKLNKICIFIMLMCIIFLTTFMLYTQQYKSEMSSDITNLYSLSKSKDESDLGKVLSEERYDKYMTNARILISEFGKISSYQTYISCVNNVSDIVSADVKQYITNSYTEKNKNTVAKDIRLSNVVEIASDSYDVINMTGYVKFNVLDKYTNDISYYFAYVKFDTKFKITSLVIY